MYPWRIRKIAPTFGTTDPNNRKIESAKKNTGIKGIKIDALENRALIKPIKTMYHIIISTPAKALPSFPTIFPSLNQSFGNGDKKLI